MFDGSWLFSHLQNKKMPRLLILLSLAGKLVLSSLDFISQTDSIFTFFELFKYGDYSKD